MLVVMSWALVEGIVAKLLVDAIGKENVLGVLMPNGEQKDISDSLEVCKYQTYTNKYFTSFYLTVEFYRKNHFRKIHRCRNS